MSIKHKNFDIKRKYVDSINMSKKYQNKKIAQKKWSKLQKSIKMKKKWNKVYKTENNEKQNKH